MSGAFGGATLVMFDGTQPTNGNTALSTAAPPTWGGGANTTDILAVFTLPAAGSNSVTNNVITFGSITSVANAYRSGTATWFRVLNGATVSGSGNQISVAGNVICDGSVGTSAADLILNSVAISAGAAVTITGFTFTVTE